MKSNYGPYPFGRMILTAALMTLVAFGWYFIRQQEAIPKVATPITDKDLNLWYRGYNEVYFMDQLPKDVVVNWGDLSGYKWMGVTVGHSIVLDKASNKILRVAKMTLLHEMCHLDPDASKALDIHGREFDACMLKVAEQGGFHDLW